MFFLRVGALSVALLCQHAEALSIAKFEEIRRSSSTALEVHVYAVASGYEWANTILKKRGEKPLYCESDTAILSAKALLQMLDGQIDKMRSANLLSKDNSDQIEFLLFLSLASAFPCPK